MSLKTRLQFSIVALVVVVVVSLSALYIHDMIVTRFQDSLDLARNNAQQVEGFVVDLVSRRTSESERSLGSIAEIKSFWKEIVEQDVDLATLLQQLAGSNSRAVIEVIVSGDDGRVLAASLPARQGQILPPIPSFEDFMRKSLWARFNELLASNQDYQVSRVLGLPDQREAVFVVHVIVSTAVLRTEMMPRVRDLGIVSALSLLLSVLLAVVASKLAFRPLTHVSEIIDRITRGEGLETAEDTPSEVAAVESKLSMLGEQFRGAQADATELRNNINQLMDRMEEAVLMFGRDDRLMMAGRGADFFLGRGRWEAMGKPLAEVFPPSDELGTVVHSAVHLQREVLDHAVVVERDGAALRLLVSVEIIEEFPSHERAGTLVTLREADPRRQIESELDVATRLAAISRLTSGAAHEIKNPLNSIALHLEVLKSKLGASSPDTAAEMEVISREITRLDRVVKSFLDFTHPIDVTMRRIDLAKIAQEVASLVSPDARAQGIEVIAEVVPEEAPIQGDRDLLIQAVLNIVVNAIESMKGGGRLVIGLAEDGSDWVLRIRDQGVGIPEEVRDKIYNLYFTTKGKGSGIGLAMTFRVVQLHGGTIDFTSEPGTGTEFRLQFPGTREERAVLPQLRSSESAAKSA
jgi:signal transduction histidine kinase